MNYKEFIELLGEYCVNDIPLSPSSFFNTLEDLYKNEKISIKSIDRDYMQEIKGLSNMPENKLIHYIHGCGQRTVGLCINIYSYDTANNNSIVFSLIENEIKILLISKSIYSGYIIYKNKKEMNISDATRI